MSKTALSLSLAIYSLLDGSEALKSATSKIFPVVVDEATLPYVAFRRARKQQRR